MLFKDLFKIPKASPSLLNKIYEIVNTALYLPDRKNKEVFIVYMLQLVIMNWDKIEEKGNLVKNHQINPVELYNIINRNVTFFAPELEKIFETRDLDIFFNSLTQKNRYGLMTNFKKGSFSIKIFDNEHVEEMISRITIQQLTFPTSTKPVFIP